jgi:2-polyprenyl-6-hydroxyphenyl methylase/3-demethylubiquinone-9 3-methyltransferase
MTLTAQQRLNDFSHDALSDRHERQHSLLEATGALKGSPYDVLDLGAGSGVTSVWAARKGWRVTAVDISSENLGVLSQHMKLEHDLKIKLCVGDATIRTMVPDNSQDIVYLKDLIEHVDDYRACLSASYRALKVGGLVYIATTNVICPLQLEYHGVGPYSWYPRWLKDRIRKLAVTSRPEIVAHTPYPALHWFSRRTLSRALKEVGFSRTWDIYDLIKTPRDLTRRTRVIYPLIRSARFIPFGRDAVDLLVVGLTMVAQK